MNRSVVLLTLAAMLMGRALTAQANPTPAAPPAPACLPTTTLDELIKALYDSVSGPGDKDRTCFRDMMLADARLIPVSKAPDGTVVPHVLTVDGWIEAVARRGSSPFFERQVKVGTEQYGHIAHLWSTYEMRLTPDGKASARGINSIQAVYDGKRWKIQEILWQAESPAELVPEKYLP